MRRHRLTHRPYNGVSDEFDQICRMSKDKTLITKMMNKEFDKNLKKYLDSFYWYKLTPDELCGKFEPYQVVPEYPSEYQTFFGNVPTVSLRIIEKRLVVSNMPKVEKLLNDNGFLMTRRTFHSYSYVHMQRRIVIGGDCSENENYLDGGENFGKTNHRTVINFSEDDDSENLSADELYITVLPTEDNKKFLTKLIKDLFKYLIDVGQSEDKFYVIAQSQRGLHTKRTNFKALPIKDNRFDLFYGKNFPHEKMQKFVSEETENLMLLHGDPGTGKSNYIKHLITNSEKKVIYIPPTMLGVISSPDFITFMMEEKNSILLIEDAEEVLSKNRNSATNNLLGLTDGFLKDSLNLKVIATFNCDVGDIDEALMRKGRLYYEYKFDTLSEEECKELLEFVGRTDIPVDGEKTLAELFNPEENSASGINTKKGMGFLNI